MIADIISKNLDLDLFPRQEHEQLCTSLVLNAMTLMFSGLRRAAPRLYRDLSVCQRCIQQSRSAILRQTEIYGKPACPRNARSNSSIATPESALRKSSPLTSLSQTIAAHEAKAGPIQARGFFPETSSKSVAYWLLGSAASVFGIVVFGGLTRLTESG